MTMRPASDPSCRVGSLLATTPATRAHSTDCDDAHSFCRARGPWGRPGCHHCASASVRLGTPVSCARTQILLVFRKRKTFQRLRRQVRLNQPLRIPHGAVTQHRPADDQQSPRRRHHCNLPSGLAPATHLIKDRAQMRVVPSHQPRHHHQQCTQQFISSAGNPAGPVHRAGFILTGHESGIRANLLGVLESPGIINHRHHNLSKTRSDADRLSRGAIGIIVVRVLLFKDRRHVRHTRAVGIGRKPAIHPQLPLHTAEAVVAGILTVRALAVLFPLYQFLLSSK